MTKPVHFEGSADIGGSGLYRYRLWRCFNDIGGPVACFVMLNPSTADANKDDPTIRRCCGFARSLECGMVMVVNLFAYRATHPRELRRFANSGGDIVGPDNDVFLREEMRACGLVVAAWGHVSPWMRPRVQEVVTIAKDVGATLHALGTTKDGHPRHPLYLRRDAKPVVWACHG